jgi:hypothetical protein
MCYTRMSQGSRNNMSWGKWDRKGRRREGRLRMDEERKGKVEGGVPTDDKASRRRPVISADSHTARAITSAWPVLISPFRTLKLLWTLSIFAKAVLIVTITTIINEDIAVIWRELVAEHKKYQCLSMTFVHLWSIDGDGNAPPGMSDWHHRSVTRDRQSYVLNSKSHTQKHTTYSFFSLMMYYAPQFRGYLVPGACEYSKSTREFFLAKEEGSTVFTMQEKGNWRMRMIVQHSNEKENNESMSSIKSRGLIRTILRERISRVSTVFSPWLCDYLPVGRVA